MNKVGRYLIGVLIVLVGVGLVSYPTVANWWNEMHSSKAMRDYSAMITELDLGDIDEMRRAAQEYNEGLLRKPDQFATSDESTRQYYETLDVTGTGIMGYITIPKLDVKLPIYHGVEDTVLQTAVGHMEGSSLPVGGESSHALLSGHRGLPSAKLFTQLDKMDVGDVFYLTVLNETYTYRVDQVKTVLPTEVEHLYIVDGRDLVTLITCTPYGVNTHRLLVRGERVDDYQNKVTFDAGSLYSGVRRNLVLVLCGFGVIILLSVVGLVIVLKGKRGSYI